ncbi:MAG: ABC transporter permease subunit, partial [Yaniella sp.]|nr:ABC transporter permease subunit [Yaniella sp.]
GRRGLLGEQLSAFGLDISFTTAAVVMAQTFVSLPFMVTSLESHLGSSGQHYERTAQSLGASKWRTFTTITLPLLRPGLISGTVLTFARALGEFGATITFAGSLQGTTRTMPLEIYLARETDPAAAVALSLVLIAPFQHRPHRARDRSRAQCRSSIQRSGWANPGTGGPQWCRKNHDTASTGRLAHARYRLRTAGRYRFL